MPPKGWTLTIEQRKHISDKVKAAWASGKLDRQCLLKAHEATRGKPQSAEHKRKRVEARRRTYTQGRGHYRPRTAWKTIHCDFCGRETSLPVRQLKRTEHHFCDMECFAKWCEDNYKGQGNAFYGRRHTEETKQKVGIKSKERKAILYALNAVYKKPNKAEVYFDEILNKHFLSDWEYTGDGKEKELLEPFNGLIPDWIHQDGKRMVLELFGDYWHSPEVIGDDWERSELGKIMIYNSLGYRCLVIWEHELKDEQAVVAKVKQFMSYK